MQLFVKDRGFYRILTAIALPIAAQNLINFAVSMADTVMLGRLGEVELSAAAIANQLGFIFTLLVFGLGSGANIMIAQYWGSGNIGFIHRVMTVTYRVLLVSTLCFMLTAVLLPREVMAIFTTDAAVIAQGTSFLRIVGFSYLLNGISTTTIFILRGVGSVRISLVVSLSSLATNVFFNYCFIFGNFGFPAMGVRGAAYGTCIARAVELVIILIYMVGFEKKVRYRISYFFQRRLGILREYLSTASPVVLNELLWGAGTAMVSVIIGRMGTQFVAANSICQVLHQLVNIIIFGVGNAAAVIIGNTIGAGHHDKVKQYAVTFTALSAILGVAGCAVVLLIKTPFIGIYNITPLAYTYAQQIISVYSVAVIFGSFSMITLIGVLRGGGDTRFVLLTDVVFLWVLSIPLGFVAGLVLSWPVPVVYAIIKSDELLKSIAAIQRVRKMEWIHDITKKAT